MREQENGLVCVAFSSSQINVSAGWAVRPIRVGNRISAEPSDQRDARAYDYPNSDCRSASRFFRFAIFPDSDVGFRVVLVTGP